MSCSQISHHKPMTCSSPIRDESIGTAYTLCSKQKSFLNWLLNNNGFVNNTDVMMVEHIQNIYIRGLYNEDEREILNILRIKYTNENGKSL